MTQKKTVDNLEGFKTSGTVSLPDCHPRLKMLLIIKFFNFQEWNHMCIAFENISKRITVAVNGNIVSNEIDEHLLDLEALVPMESLSIMGNVQEERTNSLFGKMTDLQVELSKFASICEANLI